MHAIANDGARDLLVHTGNSIITVTATSPTQADRSRALFAAGFYITGCSRRSAGHRLELGTFTETQPTVVVSCGARKDKASSVMPAELRYTGGFFRLCLAAARTLTTPERIRILSARYGLLELSMPIADYNARITDPDAVTVAEIRVQAADSGLLDQPVVVLAGAAYARRALAVWPLAVTPLAGGRGIGDHQRRLRALADRAWPASRSRDLSPTEANHTPLA